MLSSVRTLLLLGCLSAFLCPLPSASAASPAARKNPASKLFVADVEGPCLVSNGERIEALTPKTLFPAQGAIIETKADGRNSMVFSNGTGIYLDPLSQIEIKRFLQQPFVPNRTDNEVEPSISNLSAYLSRGSVALCTSKLVAGSSMEFSTPQASVAVRGRKILLEVGDTLTKVSLIDGDVTVRGGGDIDIGGRNLRTGQQAIIRQGAPGAPALVEVQDIPEAEKAELEKRVTLACMARNTVYFDEVGQNGAEAEIIATPLTPSDPAVPPISNATIPAGVAL